MIVLDASAAVEFLLGTAVGERVATRTRAEGETLHAPYLLDVEVAHALRRQVARGELPVERGREALEDLADLALERYPHAPLLGRMWELRSRLTAYDATYVALAEELDAPLVTRDARLARAGGHGARVQVIE